MTTVNFNGANYFKNLLIQFRQRFFLDFQRGISKGFFDLSLLLWISQYFVLFYFIQIRIIFGFLFFQCIHFDFTRFFFLFEVQSQYSLQLDIQKVFCVWHFSCQQKHRDCVINLFELVFIISGELIVQFLLFCNIEFVLKYLNFYQVPFLLCNFMVGWQRKKSNTLEFSLLLNIFEMLLYIYYQYYMVDRLDLIIFL
eukprot:TRINITY_DN2354_c0_g1_i4.p1 TRINITY_DN2354_c0_g1~~TRINITY_DN2354_c0_g1_i4.p1  ORF type:complete len:197 (+),score=-12.51 TRINITY_DN2354_c0_g1_i4:646-1236(+)